MISLIEGIDMGCDIHLYVERLIEGKWVQQLKSDEKMKNGSPTVDAKYWYYGRNYALFGLLAGVRNHDLTPLVSPRDLPKDMSEGLTREWSFNWSEDGHTPTYYYLDELIKFREQPIVFIRSVNMGQYKKFKTEPEFDLYHSWHAVYQNGKYISNKKMDRIFKIKSFLNDGDNYLTKVTGQIMPAKLSEIFWVETLNTIAALDSNPKNLRLVMWFDS